MGPLQNFHIRYTCISYIPIGCTVTSAEGFVPCRTIFSRAGCMLSYRVRGIDNIRGTGKVFGTGAYLPAATDCAHNVDTTTAKYVLTFGSRRRTLCRPSKGNTRVYFRISQ